MDDAQREALMDVLKTIGVAGMAGAGGRAALGLLTDVGRDRLPPPPKAPEPIVVRIPVRTQVPPKKPVIGFRKFAAVDGNSPILEQALDAAGTGIRTVGNAAWQGVNRFIGGDPANHRLDNPDFWKMPAQFFGGLGAAGLGAYLVDQHLDNRRRQEAEDDLEEAQRDYHKAVLQRHAGVKLAADPPKTWGGRLNEKVERFVLEHTPSSLNRWLNGGKERVPTRSGDAVDLNNGGDVNRNDSLPVTAAQPSTPAGYFPLTTGLMPPERNAHTSDGKVEALDPQTYANRFAGWAKSKPMEFTASRMLERAGATPSAGSAGPNARGMLEQASAIPGAGSAGPNTREMLEQAAETPGAASAGPNAAQEMLEQASGTPSAGSAGPNAREMLEQASAIPGAASAEPSAREMPEQAAETPGASSAGPNAAQQVDPSTLGKLLSEWGPTLGIAGGGLAAGYLLNNWLNGGTRKKKRSYLDDDDDELEPTYAAKMSSADMAAAIAGYQPADPRIARAVVHLDAYWRTKQAKTEYGITDSPLFNPAVLAHSISPALAGALTTLMGATALGSGYLAHNYVRDTNFEAERQKDVRKQLDTDLATRVPPILARFVPVDARGVPLSPAARRRVLAARAAQ